MRWRFSPSNRLPKGLPTCSPETFDVIAKGEEPSRIRVNTVRFSPGARTAWHSPRGRTDVHVTEGQGLVQARAGQIVEIRPGGHDLRASGGMALARRGAAPDHFMTHIAMWEAPADGAESDWGAHVTDAEYLGQEQ